MLTQERLKELFYYEQETGIFTWLIKPGKRIKIGAKAGRINSQGYVQIGINNKLYQAHRLAVLYMTGRFPENDVDHINGIRNDNKWLNLRECNDSQNAENQKKAKVSNKSTGLLGVYPQSNNKGTFYAKIMVNKKLKHLGSFKTKELAYQAYLEAKRELHEFNTL